MYREGRPERKTVPINVILDGRSVLVVGYGKVGQRKEKLLLEAGARVEVIAPEVNRAFEPGDCAGRLLVFACTDDKHVNARILEDARLHHVPCCISDMNWADGDFVTPATTRVAGAVVGVSTNGACCGGAKEIKNAVADFLRRRAEAKIIVMGTSDRFLSPEKRAPFHLPPEARREMVSMLREIKGVEELVVLNTCNRVEVALRGCVNLDVVRRLMRLHRLREDEYFVLEEQEAFAHLVKVTAGLESAFAGEFHVVAQVKEALGEAEKAGMLGGRLRGLFDDVLRVAKEVRHATEEVLEVSDVDLAAASFIRETRGETPGRVVVMGSGAVGRGVCRALGGDVSLIHHGDRVPPCDVLVCACAADGPFVTHEVLDATPSLVIDLGMPPNVSEDVPHVSLEDLKDRQRRRSGALDRALALADGIIAGADVRPLKGVMT